MLRVLDLDTEAIIRLKHERTLWKPEVNMDEVELNRVRHEKNVWGGIALGLGVTLILLIGFGAVAGVFLAKRSHMERMQAMDAMERERMLRVEAEAIKAAQKQK